MAEEDQPVGEEVGQEVPETIVAAPPEEEGKEGDEEDKEEEEEEDEPFVETIPVANEDYEESLVLQLGDRIIIQSTEYGQVHGTVYYRDNTLLRLKPDGGNILYDFDRDYDPDTKVDAFAEKYGVEASYILRKRKYPDFIRQQDFKVGQTLAGILPNGKAGPFLQVRKLNEEEDSIKLVNIDDPEDTYKLKFKFKGIPLAAPFRILQIAAPPGVDLKEEQAKARKAAAAASGVSIEQAAEEPIQEEEEEGEDAEDLEVLADEEYKIIEEDDIVVPQQRIIKEAAASQKIIPETLQKADAINDFLNMLDVSERKHPKAIRERRILVEILANMKREITEFHSNGTIKGIKRPSANTLFELIKKADVPMGRAVLDIEKRLYTDIKYKPTEEETSYPRLSEREHSQYALVEDAWAKPLLTNGTKPNPMSSAFVDTGAGASNQVQFYVEEQTSYEQDERPWKPGTSGGPDFEIRKDMLFFRSRIPDLNNAEVDGYDKAPPKERDSKEIPFPEITKLFYGVETALTTTFRKQLKGPKIPLINDESAPLNAYLLFPAEAAPWLGTKRSGSLALDVMRGKEAMVWMTAILQRLGEIQETSKVSQIVPLKVDGTNLAANIRLTDYLDGLTLPGMGYGDMLIDLGNYGLNQLEFTPDILRTLQTKIDLYQKQLITSINQLKAANATIPEPIANPMLPIDTTNIVDAFIRKEPLLVASLKAFETQNPTLKLSDIARIVHFLKYDSDFWQATVGQQEGLYRQERAKTIKTMQLEIIKNDQIVQKNRANRGAPPKPNTCEHVANLIAIRKLKDEDERYVALTKFLAKYQGSRREDNWITCNVCQLELLCVHERLLVKAFLSPLEKEIIFKDINLNFSGGIFQGYYICRSCGQPIQEIGYDTSIQFDEQGRPMVGRGVLNDKEAVSAEEIASVLSKPIKEVEEYEFTDPDQAAYYLVARELAERIGIYMDRKGYKRVTKHTQKFMALYPNRKTFIKMEKERKEKKAAKSEAYEMKDYDVVIAKTQICVVAILLLYEIQSHIPEYIPQYSLPMCDAGFGGHPLEENRASIQGITYLACAIAAIGRDDEPWLSARFFQSGKGGREKQIADILKYMTPIREDIETKMNSLQGPLVEKRIWKMEQLGVKALSGPKEMVPKSFLPELILPTVAEAAAEPVVEGAMDTRALVKAWIRNAHAEAQKNSKPERGSPFVEITCCKTPIRTPGAFWRADLSPMPLPGRVLTPSRRPPVQQFHFEARTQEALIQETPKDLTYRLFLSVCHSGDRLGLPHEPGLTNLCHSCGFQFPTHPSIVDPDEAKEAISKQNIDTNVETFQILLDAVHNHCAVAPHSLGTPEPWSQTLESIETLKPAPIESWDARFRRTIRRLNRLEGSVGDGDVAAILAETKLADGAEEAKTFVREMFAKKIKLAPDVLASRYKILDSIAKLPWHNFVQVMETYLLKVGKNLLFQFKSDTLLLYGNPKLSEKGNNDIRDALTADNAVMNTFAKEFYASDNKLAREKMTKYVMQLTAIVRLKNKIRPVYFVGGQATFKYIQMSFFYGPLAELFDSSKLPFEEGEEAEHLPGYRELEEDEEEEEEEEEKEEVSTLVKREAKKGSARGTTDVSIPLLVRIINSAIFIYKKYELTYDDTKIKEALEERAEKEKQQMIASREKMNAEERTVYAMHKKYGIGRFDVDTKKKVQNYDIDQANLEARINAEAGIITGLDQPGAVDEMTPEGWEVDAEGYQVRTEEDIEASEAYDNGDGGEFQDEMDRVD